MKPVTIETTTTTTYEVAFTLSRPGLPPVSRDETDLFLVQEVCPLVGKFRVIEALGFDDGNPQPQLVLTTTAPGTTDDAADVYLALLAIALHYRERFGGEVTITSHDSTVDFIYGGENDD
jgi:hypothetical protein